MENDNRTLPLLSSPYKGEEQAGSTGFIVHPVTIKRIIDSHMARHKWESRKDSRPQVSSPLMGESLP